MKNKNNAKTFLIMAIIFMLPSFILFPSIIDGRGDFFIIFITFFVVDLFIWGMFIKHIVRGKKREKIISEGKEYIATYISYKFALSVNQISYFYITYFWKNEYGVTEEGESLGYYSADEVQMYRNAKKFRIKVMGNESAIISKPSDVIEKSEESVIDNGREVVCEYCSSSFGEVLDQCPYCGAARKKDNNEN